MRIPLFSLIFYCLALIYSILVQSYLLLILVAVIFYLRSLQPLLAEWSVRSRLLSELKLNPANQDTQLKLIESLIKLRQFKAAQVFLEQLGETSVEPNALSFLQAQIDFGLKNHNRALQDLEKIQDPKFKYGEALFLRSLTLMKLQSWERAQQDLKEFLKINTSSVEAYFHLAKIQVRLGLRQEASQTRKEGLSTYLSLPYFRAKKERKWYFLLLFRFDRLLSVCTY
jgi:tetratricopeptide (TPR) repeat protein